jgi:HEPN domain-containing protein
MPERVEDWIAKAEGDFNLACREFARGEEANHDGICFHAQQCIEKLMKAVLFARGIEFPKTHNLVYLDEMLRPVIPLWVVAKADLEFLTRSGVTFRYPGEWATAAHSVRAMSICKSLRGDLLVLLGERLL